MKNIIYICLVIGALSLIVGIIAKIAGVMRLAGITPGGFLLFTSVCLLAGLNFGILDLMKPRALEK